MYHYVVRTTLSEYRCAGIWSNLRSVMNSMYGCMSWNLQSRTNKKIPLFQCVFSSTYVMDRPVLQKCTSLTYTYTRRDKNAHPISAQRMEIVSGDYLVASRRMGNVNFGTPRLNSTDWCKDSHAAHYVSTWWMSIEENKWRTLCHTRCVQKPWWKTRYNTLQRHVNFTSQLYGGVQNNPKNRTALGGCTNAIPLYASESGTERDEPENTHNHTLKYSKIDWQQLCWVQAEKTTQFK